MMASIIAQLAACRRGVSAVELALVLPIFFLFLFGIINVSLLLWTQASLFYAVQTAARCAAINSPDCGSPESVKNYAMNNYFGQSLGRSDLFAYSSLGSGCGHTVSTVDGLTYDMTIPFYGAMPISLSATACFP
jgi:Flp pilus assembly protein TadG